MNWVLDIQRGTETSHYEGSLDMTDLLKPLHDNLPNCLATEVSRITTTVQRSLDYGQLKVSCTVSLQCPQTKPWLDWTSLQAFRLATMYLNSGFSWLVPEVPPFPVPPENP